MARYLYHSPQILAPWYLTSASRCRTQIQTFRDEIRSLLDPNGTGDNWLVTDISEWSGSDNCNGGGFVIEHRDGTGTKTGHEWFFATPINGQKNNSNHEARDFFDGSQVSSYYRRGQTGVADRYDGTSISLHYNHDGGTEGYDHQRTDDGTNEFAAPPTSPQNSMSTFFPSHTLMRGTMIQQEYRLSNKNRWNWIMLFDDQKPFIQLAAISAEYDIGPYSLQGQILTPYDTNLDSSKTGVFYYASSGAASSDELHENNMRIECLDSGGTKQDMNPHWDNTFTLNNTPRSDGNYPWRPVSVSNSNAFKGYLDTDIVREQGPYDRVPFEVYSGPQGPFIHWHRALSFAWKSGEPPYPPGRRFSDILIPEEGS